MTDRPIFLRFSIGGAAGSIAICLIVVGSFAFLAYKLVFDPDDLPQSSRRSGAIWDFLRSGNGMVGAGIMLLGTMYFLRFLVRALRHFFTDGKAASLTGSGLILHPTYRCKGEIPFDEVRSATVARNPYGGWFFKSFDLTIEFVGRRRVHLRQPEIDGGKEALEAFAAEIEARKTFGETAPPGQPGLPPA